MLGAHATAQTPALIIAFLVWAPTVNAASVILVVGPYRRAVFRQGSTAVSTEMPMVIAPPTVTARTLALVS